VTATKLSRSFTVSSYTFTPSPTGSGKNHRLRVPLRFTGRDPVAVIDFATRVRGEALLVRIDLKDGTPKVEAVGRFEGANVRIPKGEKKPPVTLRIVFESEEIVPIEAVLQAGLRAARASLLELDLELSLVQGRLPGMEEEEAPKAEAAPAAPEKKKGRRPKGPRALPKAGD